MGGREGTVGTGRMGHFKCKKKEKAKEKKRNKRQQTALAIHTSAPCVRRAVG